MEYKKSIIIIILAIFFVSIASVCAADANDVAIAGEDAQMVVSSNNVMGEDNLETSEDDAVLAQQNDEPSVGETDSQTPGESIGNYTDLRNDIARDGNLTKSRYVYCYGDGDGIIISTPSMIINGNGAVIDMSGSDIHAFTVQESNVTIRNLTIENAYSIEFGAAIYFEDSFER